MRRVAFAAAVLLVMCLGCSGSSGTGGDDTVDAVPDIGPGDVAEDEAPVCVPTAETLDTLPDQPSVFAGETLGVKCEFTGCPDAGEGFGLVVGGVEGQDYELDGGDVTFKVPGSYQVACTFPGPEGDAWQDATPAQVEVLPGIPDRVETALAATEAKAGQTVGVECHAFDAFDNEIFGQWMLAVDPEGSVTAAGQSVMAKAVGEYAVSCVLDGLHADPSPATLEVVPNVPARVYTDLTSSTIVAGESAGITCKATDIYDNKVTAFPMVVAVPAEVSLVGLKVSSIIAGFYEVKCVPQAMDWSLFKLFPATLTVTPGAPVVIDLTLVPDKPIYKVLDKVQILAAARDGYLNLVPDAEYEPVEIVPPAGVGPLQTWVFKFLDVGEHDFVVTLKGNPAVTATAHVIVDGQGPLLSVDTPERGATLDDKPAVTVAGTVSDQVAGLASFTVNDVPVEVQPDHSFSTVMPAAHGVNRIVAQAADEGGETTRTVRSFAWSKLWYPAEGDDAVTFVPSGMQLYLSENFVDDGNHDPADPDDLATLMEVVLSSLDFGAFISNPVYDANSYKVFVKNIQLNQPTVTMDLIEGGLSINAAFNGFSADVDAVGECKVLFVDMCPDVSGTLHIESISLYASMQVGLDAGGNVAVTLTSMEMGVGNPSLDLSGLAGNLLEPILNAVISMFEKNIEEAVKGQLEGMLPGVIADLFSQFELSQKLELPAIADGATPVNISLDTRYAALLFSPSGIEMQFNARASSTKKVTHDPLGSLGRGTCGGPDEPAFVISKGSEVAVALSDDLLNQVLFSAWWGGAVNVTLPESALESVVGSLSGYGISNLSLELDFFLAPMLSDCNPDGALRFGVGDLYLQAKMKMLGQPISLGAFVMLLGDASIALTDEGGSATFGLTVEEIGVFDYEIVSVTQGFEDLVPIIDELIQSGVVEGALAGIAGQSFGGIELPEIDLSSVIPGVPAGTKIAIHPNSLERSSGYTELTGIIE